MKRLVLSIIGMAGLLCGHLLLPEQVCAQDSRTAASDMHTLPLTPPETQASPGKSLRDVALDSALTNHKLIYFGKGEEPPQDSVTNLIRHFYENQFRHISDPLAPYFLFLSKDSKLAMGMGGCVRMRGYLDWGGSIPSPGFAPYLIPMQKGPMRERYLGTTPAGTCLFFRVIGTNKKLGNYQIYIEANFNGYEARDFRLKKAYATINDWTIGYANSTFSDPQALPPVIDASGPNAKMSATSVLVRWMHDLPKGFTIAASLETPDQSIETVENVTAKASQYIPDVAVFAQWKFNTSDHIRLAAIYRSFSYRDLLSSRNRYAGGWGLQFSSIWSPVAPLTLYGTFNGGAGYASLGGDWLMGDYDLVADRDRPGRLYSPYTIGGFACVQYNFTPQVFVSGTFGGTRYLPRYAMQPDEYKEGLYMAANVYWYLTPRISCGAEIDLGRRKNADGNARWARRLNLMAQFSF